MPTIEEALPVVETHLRDWLAKARERYHYHFEDAAGPNIVTPETIEDLEQARADILSILSALRWIEAMK